MIPKVIHYCWFGGKPLDSATVKNIETWHKIMPDYEIKRWDESNFSFSTCEFAQKAYENKKWAFVADYFRAWVLYNYGGIYLDTDVVVYKEFDDMLNTKFFIGCEDIGWLTSATFGCEEKHPIIKKILESFHKTPFVVDGKERLCTMPMRITDIIVDSYGLWRIKNKTQRFDDLVIFPREYFCPLLYGSKEVKVSAKTYSEHLFYGSWIDGKKKQKGIYVKRLIKKLLFFLFGYKRVRTVCYGKCVTE